MARRTKPEPRLLREDAAAEFLAVTVSAVRKWRLTGAGPAFIKYGESGAVRYHIDDLTGFIDAGRRPACPMNSDPGALDASRNPPNDTRLVAATSPVTATTQTRASGGLQRGAQDHSSGVRLLSLRAAAAYLGLSYWSTRDLVANGTIPTVRIPAARVDAGQRGANPKARERLVVPAGDARIAGQSARRILIDRVDLDRLIEHWKGSLP